MARSVYLSKQTLVGMIVFLLLCFLFRWWGGLVWGSLICGAGVFLFRRHQVNYKNLLSYTECFYAPIHGFVKAIKTNHNDELLFEICLPHGSECGFYFSCVAEVEKTLTLKPAQYFRYHVMPLIDENYWQEYGQKIIFKNQFNELFYMQVISCYLGVDPKLWVNAGDRGRSGANFGFLGFGGTVIVSIPKNWNPMIKQGSWIKPGETILARREEKREESV